MSGPSDKFLCVVTVGFTHVVLPYAAGVKVMALLEGATEADFGISVGSDRFEPTDRPLTVQMERLNAPGRKTRAGGRTHLNASKGESV